MDFGDFISPIVALALALVGGIVWLVRLEGRQNVSDARTNSTEKRVDSLEERIFTKLDRIDARLESILDRNRT